MTCYFSVIIRYLKSIFLFHWINYFLYYYFFMYCNICPKVEFQSLISIESHIRLKDPEKHKAKLIELLQQENENKSKEH